MMEFMNFETFRLTSLGSNVTFGSCWNESKSVLQPANFRTDHSELLGVYTVNGKGLPRRTDFLVDKPW